MKRFILSALAFLGFAAGFGLAILDGARSIAGNAIDLTPLGKTLFQLLPRHFPMIEPAITRHVHPLLWDPLLLNVFLLPTFLVCFAVGFSAWWLTVRRPRAPEVPAAA
jgi:hypothetical protein